MDRLLYPAHYGPSKNQSLTPAQKSSQSERSWVEGEDMLSLLEDKTHQFSKNQRDSCSCVPELCGKGEVPVKYWRSSSTQVRQACYQKCTTTETPLPGQFLLGLHTSFLCEPLALTHNMSSKCKVMA